MLSQASGIWVHDSDKRFSFSLAKKLKSKVSKCLASKNIAIRGTGT